MKPMQTLVFAAILLLATANHAVAFNFGFVRVPDWMDRYLAWLTVATAVFALILSAVKPRGVPVHQLYYVRLSPMVRIIHICSVILVSVTLILFFLGMGLRRYAEL